MGSTETEYRPAYEDAPDDMRLVEMANLTERDTAIPGWIYVSSQRGRHGPRVKYYVERPARRTRCMSVAISDEARIFNDRLPADVVERIGPLVQAWVRQNKDALLAFWNDGYRWSREEVDRFLLGLRKLGQSVICSNRHL